MSKQEIQAEIFAPNADPLLVSDAEISYQADFLEAEVADALFDQLLRHTAWRQDTITVFGKQHLTPRLSCWVADPGLTYQYSHLTMQAEPWTQSLAELRETLHHHCGYDFNSVLLNYYRDGQDTNGWHCDNEAELGRNPVIASLSLGATRDFLLRRIANHTDKRRLALAHGSLLLMSGETQHRWQHQIPRRSQAGARINLTFRQIKHQAKSCTTGDHA